MKGRFKMRAIAWMALQTALDRLERGRHVGNQPVNGRGGLPGMAEAGRDAEERYNVVAPAIRDALGKG